MGWKEDPDVVQVTITAKQAGREDFTETSWLDALVVGKLIDDPIDAWKQYSAEYLRRWIEEGRAKDE
jgi:hypothetical protein